MRGDKYHLSSLYFPLHLTANKRALAGAGIIAQHEKDLSIFQVMFSSYVVNVTKFCFCLGVGSADEWSPGCTVSL